MIGFNYLGKLGQLGNQMFQYASALGVAEGIGTSCCIPKHDDVMVDALGCLLYTSPSPRDGRISRMPSSA